MACGTRPGRSGTLPGYTAFGPDAHLVLWFKAHLGFLGAALGRRASLDRRVSIRLGLCFFFFGMGSTRTYDLDSDRRNPPSLVCFVWPGGPSTVLCFAKQSSGPLQSTRTK
ncbi:hypothetical protein LX36DRAFT_469091 [Colletotrichum falcatum]|nr:hypothetical protein LX36DRAFT_469091 [Colletotrichum falcatum]